MDFVSGDRFDGFYESTIVIDESFGPSGDYSINESNSRFKDPSGYQGNNVNNLILTVVNNSSMDFDAPVLSSYTISPTSVDISSGAVSITASIRAADTSGVITPTSNGAYLYYQGNYVYGSTWTLVSGDRFDGFYESTIVIDESFGPSGDYSINESNSRFKDPSGYQGNNVNNLILTVVNNSSMDFDAPVLSSYTISPTSVDISSGAVSITASIRAADTSGVITPTSNGAYLYYQGNYVYGSTWTLVSGDRFDGFYESTIVIDESFGPSGDYSINESNSRFKDPSGYQGNNVNNLILTVVNFSGTTSPSVGDGTESDPFEVDSFSDLWWISQDSRRWGYHYVQTADIDASTSSHLDFGKGFNPIGNVNTKFTGSYDGQGFSINNLFISRVQDNEIGLFGHVENGILKNINLYKPNITGDIRVGAIVGELVNSSNQFLSNHVKEGYVLGNTTTGGLVGRLGSYSQVHESSYTGTVTGYSSSQNFNGGGDPKNIGGLIGKIKPNGVLTKSFFKGYVYGVSYVGGIVGMNSGNEISNSYSIGKVVGENIFIGGISGSSEFTNSNDGRIHNYTSTFVQSLGNSSSIGPIVGHQVTLPGISYEGADNFWNSTINNLSSAGGNIDFPKSIEELKNPKTFTDEGWDFDNTWIITGNLNDGFPILRGNNELNIENIDFDYNTSKLIITYSTPVYENG